MSTLLKCVLLLSSGIAMHISSSSPTPPYHKKNCNYLFESWVHRIGYILKAILWAETTADVVVTLLTTRSSARMLDVERRILEGVCPPSTIRFPRLQPSFAFIISASVLILSGALRRMCYKKLGKMFTFEVTIQPGHKLVTTGPYAFARHPSYLSAVSACVSASAVMLTRGSFARECLFTQPLEMVKNCVGSSWACRRPVWSCAGVIGDMTVVQMSALAFLGVWVFCVATVTRNVLLRLTWEEEVLRKEFGQQWTAYTETVRWRMIPGIL